jgi:hypothetical protein
VGSHRTATGLAHLASGDIGPHVLARLDLTVFILAGSLIILATWEWMKRR